MNESKSSTSMLQNAEHHSRGFKTAAILISGMVLTTLVAQNIYNWVALSSMSNWIGALGAIAVVSAFIAVLYKPLLRIIDTPFFAILSLLFIAVGTALGTFVAQNAAWPVFTQRYGETGSKILRILQMDDVFHSWWYVGFFVLLAGSLIKISTNKGFGKGTLGFHLAHLSPILILFGFWVDYFNGFRGIIQLETGNSTNVAKIYLGNTGYVKDSAELDFKIRLDDFEFENHEPDYRLQIWKREAPVEQTGMEAMQNQNRPTIIASLPLEKGKIHHIYNTDVGFRLVDFYPNFHFEYTYPEVTDTIEPKNPAILVEIKTPFGEDVLQLRAYEPARSKLADPHMGSSLEMYWELPDDVFDKKTEVETTNPEWAKMGRIIFAGQERKIYYVQEGEVTSEAMEIDKFCPFPGKEKGEGFTIVNLVPDAAYLSAVPATKNEKLENPVANVEVWGKSRLSEFTYLYPGMLKGRRGGFFQVPGTNYLLALESIKDRETKFWKSSLSVLGAGDEVVKEKVIKVNEPMLYKNYRFYQTDYDPNNPEYSGIGISHEPGLYIIYFGFFALVIGCAMLFYYHKKL